MDTLGVLYTPFPSSMEKVRDQYLAYVCVLSTLDGVPAVAGDYRYLKNYVDLSSKGVEGIHLNGILTQKNGTRVHCMSADEALAIFEEKLADGAIFLSDDEKIERIGLYYYIDYETRQFFPVWCLCEYLWEARDSLVPIVYIDAETGELMD